MGIHGWGSLLTSARPFHKSVTILFVLALMVACITAGGLLGFWREVRVTSVSDAPDHRSLAALVFHVTGARIALKDGVQGKRLDKDRVLVELDGAKQALRRLTAQALDHESKARFDEIAKILSSTGDTLSIPGVSSALKAYEDLWRAGELCQVVSSIALDKEAARIERGQRLSRQAVWLLALGGGISLLGLLMGIFLLRRMRASYEKNLDEALAAAMVHPQTGLYTLSCMEMRLFEEVERAKRQSKKFLVLHIIPENGKDSARRKDAGLLRQVFRNYDLLADDDRRFLVLLFDFKMNHVSGLLKRLAVKLPGVQIRTRQFPRDGDTVAALLRESPSD